MLLPLAAIMRHAFLRDATLKVGMSAPDGATPRCRCPLPPLLFYCPRRLMPMLPAPLSPPLAVLRLR